MNVAQLFTSIAAACRRVPWPGRVGLVLGTACLLGCNTDPASTPRDPQAHKDSGAVSELRFDRRYLDSIALGPPYSERTLREWAIRNQLGRLEDYNRFKAEHLKEDSSATYGPVDESFGDGPERHFPNGKAYLTDVYRQMDSLKTLEHIPLTPYPPMQAYEN